MSRDDRGNFVTMYCVANGAFLLVAYLIVAFVAWNWSWPAGIGRLDHLDRLMMIISFAGIQVAAVMVSIDFTKWCRKNP